MKLSEVIGEFEKDAESGEQQAKHGSPVSSLAEDVAEGQIAGKLREVIEKLKKVTSL